MKRRYREVQGVRMHWEELGEGLPVVMVHGFATSPSLWRHVIPRIQQSRCLAWELVGYGSSIPQGEGRDLSAARQAEYMLDWLQTLRIRRAVFVGHDLGGAIVQIAAAQRPETCAGLVLINSIGYDAWPVMMTRASRVAGRLIERLPEPIFRAAFRRFLRLGHIDRPHMRNAFALYWTHYAKHGARALVRQARALDLRDTRHVIARLRNLDVPMRVVWAAGNRFLPSGYGFRFARDLNAPARYIPKDRHFTPEDNPAVVADVIGDIVTEWRGKEQPTRRRRYG
jgi:pimeloyl-ACP methyl ester carboxylesterase